MSESVYAIANQKGGVGKTTTTVNLAAVFAAEGRRTLVVDLDQQANATVALGIPKRTTPSSYEVLAGEVAAIEAVVPGPVPNLELIPASRDLAGSAVELASVDDPPFRLSRQLGPLTDRYDAILLDCPPALGLVTVNALVASDRVIVPVQAEYLALEGLIEFLDTLATVRRELNPSLELAGVVVTMHDERTRLAQDVERDVRDHFSETVFQTVVPRTVRLAEAPSYGLPVSEYAPGSRGASAYRSLAAEVTERG
ncbi:MAG: ParA family protein [Solirubrobacterales bacterium]